MVWGEGGLGPSFFYLIFADMYSLLSILDASQNLYYVPTSTIQDVRRINANTVRIFTNINNDTPDEYLSYDLIESGTGAGVADTRQVTAIINTWVILLKGNQSSVRVPLPFELSSVSNTISSWAESTQASSGTATLDFGDSNMVAEVVVTGVAETLITSIVLSSMRMEATPEHTVDDMEVDPIRLAVKDLVAGVGFTIYGAMDNAPANGTYKIDWNLTN